jgi:hypothetical protein
MRSSFTYTLHVLFILCTKTTFTVISKYTVTRHTFFPDCMYVSILYTRARAVMTIFSSFVPEQRFTAAGVV